MPATLGDAEVEAYSRDGVIRIRQFFNHETISEIRGEVERYTQEALPFQEKLDCTFEADGSTIRNLWRLEQHSNYFRLLTERQEVSNVVGKLIPGDAVLVGLETFNKPARIGSRVPLHQDNAYFCRTPPDVLTLWIAIDPVTVENGAVYYLKGSHRLGMLPTKPSGTAGNSIGLAQPPETPEAEQFCCTLRAGDLAIHHCQTIHHSKPNHSEQSRLGLVMVFRSAQAETDPALMEDYQATKKLG